MNPVLTCYSGVGTVTGANFMLTYGDTSILIDCGLIQGTEDSYEANRAPFGYDPQSVDMLFATHAHVDHIGRIPRLVKEGFRGSIYSTHVTRELAELMFDDALGVMGFKKKEKGEVPMYEKKDVEQALSQWKTFEYEMKENVTEDVSVKLYEAGHILGSSMIEFEVDDKKILFTGDLGNDASALLPPTASVDHIDYMLMDSVYGDRNHENIEESKGIFRGIVLETIKRGGGTHDPSLFSRANTRDTLSSQ